MDITKNYLFSKVGFGNDQQRLNFNSQIDTLNPDIFNNLSVQQTTNYQSIFKFMLSLSNKNSQQESLVLSKLQQDILNEQNRLKQTRQQLIHECKYIQNKISQQLQTIKETSRLINQAAQAQTKVFHESLNSDQYSKDVIDFNTLSSYLKKQKAYLSDIVATSESSSRPKSSKELLHKLSNQRRMQKYLQQLQSFKLQKQIEYLEKYILVGQAKDGRQMIAYEDVQSVTMKQQKEQVERLKHMIEELERLVGLSNECGGNVNNEMSEKTVLLKSQSERLQMIQDVLERESRQIVQVKDFFKDYEPKQITQLLYENTKQRESNCLQKQNQDQNNQTNLSKQQLQFILSFTPVASSMQIFKQPYQQVNDLIKTCKTKLKKIKS